MMKTISLFGTIDPEYGIRWNHVEKPSPSADDSQTSDLIRKTVWDLYDSHYEVSSESRANDAAPAFPKVSRVIFNDPATKVYFEDGTTSLVKASKDDKFSKEAGLAFAILKRLLGTPDDRGNYISNGYMMELKRIVEKAYDQKASQKAPEKKTPEKKTPGKKAPEKKASEKKTSGKKSA